ncbi:MAG: methyltransferase domain-containing protein [Nitrospirae bacterium]|nr:methyltransferase domain-containing protein [Candidatus Troglogloeales bacterium]
MILTDDLILYAPSVETIRLDGATLLLDPARPNWAGTDETGSQILALFNGKRTFGEVVLAYAATNYYEFAKAWQHVETITHDAIRQQLLSASPISPMAYPGRSAYLSRPALSELWIHANNACNLSCAHCLVSSGPDGDQGLPTAPFLKVIAEARTLGARRFFFTGGEPFLRKDIFDLIDAALLDPKAEAAILTNGILLTDAKLAKLKQRDAARLRLQISLDGATPQINDPIRGVGSFQKIVTGIRAAIGAGLSVAVSTVITDTNFNDVPNVTRLIGEIGGTNHHLLWMHKRGRADAHGADAAPTIEQVIKVVRSTREVGQTVGVMIDNHEAIKARLRYPVGTKRDLASAAVSSLCVYADGTVYPSAAMANVPELYCGNILRQSLKEILSDSPVAQSFQQATVEKKPICCACPLKFLCGGGDVEHSYFYGGSIQAHDPYCDLHKAMFADAFHELTETRKGLVSNGKSGFSAPVLFTGMGEMAIHCATEQAPSEVITSCSECILSFDLDAPRKVVRQFYGEAAETPSEDLCCPVQPDPSDLTHIPIAVVERFYGCGSPVGSAGIKLGETTLDLGSGAGIDVFIAAKKVGSTGKAIGVDMTPQMLKVAREAQREVAAHLGYDVVEFREGFLEAIPAADKTVDLITSNCVINLSPDKKAVFAEMWRVLNDHGRIVVADIVADQRVPPHQRKDPRLWGECISGALTEEEFMAYLERAGFYGLQMLKKSFWKEVDGYRFYSVTVRGYKYEKKAGCVYIGQSATYLGPLKAVSDDEGHWFPRNTPVTICTDTAEKLSHPPYAGLFTVIGVDQAGREISENGCDPAQGCC